MVCGEPSLRNIQVWTENILSIKTWLLFFRIALLSSTFFGSLFMASCIFSACIVYLASKRWKAGVLVFSFFPLYLLCILTSTYYGLLAPSILPTLKFLCFPLNIFNGCFFFVLGKYISEKYAALCKRYSVKKCIIGVVLSYLMFFAEVFMCQRYSVLGATDAAFSLIPVSFFLFMLCIQIKTPIKNHLTFRKLSTIVYCGQADILCLWGFGKQYLHINSYTILYLLSAAAMTILCVVVLKLQKQARWKWCKYMA